MHNFYLSRFGSLEAVGEEVTKEEEEEEEEEVVEVEEEEEEDDKKLANTVSHCMSESKQVFEFVSKLVSPHTHKIRIRLVYSAESMVDSEIFGLFRPKPRWRIRCNPKKYPFS